ncbi:MAG: hypothetical protein JXA41_05930 [Deltaproteobacteria bacterium]|nr:hypothetical protein [Deltaproteobacteria bacterium]
MKKIFVFVFAALIVLAFTSPSQAVKVTKNLDIGVKLLVDAYYYNQDKEGMARTVGSARSAGLIKGTTTLEEDLTQTYLTINSRSSLYFIFNDEDKVGFYIAPNIDGENYNLGVLYAYGFWNVTPDFRIQTGRGTTLFSDLEPDTTMGCNVGAEAFSTINKMYGVGYGNYFSGYTTYFQVAYRLGDMGHVKVGIVDPRATSSDDAKNVIGISSNSKTVAIDPSTKIPRLELAVPVHFGGVSLHPSVFWQKQTFNNVQAGHDDSVTSYGVSLGVKADFKPIFFKAEVNYGENWGNTKDQTYTLKEPDYATFGSQVSSAKADTSGKIQNSEALGWWLQAGIRLGKAEPSIIIGRQEFSREYDNLKDEMKTMMYGITCPIDITPGFKIRPEIMIYDNGDSNKIAVKGTSTIPTTNYEYDFGKELLAGIQFEFTF